MLFRFFGIVSWLQIDLVVNPVFAPIKWLAGKIVCKMTCNVLSVTLECYHTVALKMCPICSFEKGINVARDLSICTACKMYCAFLKWCMHNLQISDLILTLTLTQARTLILSLARLHSKFCKLCKLTNCTQPKHR